MIMQDGGSKIMFYWIVVKHSMFLQQKLASLVAATTKRRNKLISSSEYLQFNWKADLVDSWISKQRFHSLNIIVVCLTVLSES